MTQVTCPGLPADWINGWLAAVGATVLDARIRLHWTTDGAPFAVLSAAAGDPVNCLVESWPDTALLSDLPIGEDWKGAGTVRRKVPVEAFVTRARAARSHRYSWTLSSTMTDLCVDENGEVAHAPFDPAGPGTIKWLHHRLMKIHEQVEPSVARIRDSFAGQAVRVKDNGLGFDQTRLGSLSDVASIWNRSRRRGARVFWSGHPARTGPWERPTAGSSRRRGGVAERMAAHSGESGSAPLQLACLASAAR